MIMADKYADRFPNLETKILDINEILFNSKNTYKINNLIFVKIEEYGKISLRVFKLSKNKIEQVYLKVLEGMSEKQLSNILFQK